MNEVKKYSDFYKMTSTFGLIMGLAMAAIHFIFYLLEYSVQLPFVMMILTFAAVIAVIIYSTKKYRYSLGGYISYWTAFKFGVIIFLFAGIFYAIYSYVFNNIDPEYAFRQLERSKEFLSTSGIDEKTINEVITASQTQLAYEQKHPFETIFTSGWWNMFLGAIFCLISSAFLKKNKPETIYES
ncbi:MAG: DUF4199 domain-containing protein [Prevotellaceae bacterium]|jgi:hypothetical protein|nr:DUF4199 domain-containing protein [Prevotellaceae bacterium]